MRKILYFSTPWCAPCKALAPMISSAASQLSIQKVDAELEPQLAKQYGIRSVPTFIFLERGEEVHRHVGALTREMLFKLASP